MERKDITFRLFHETGETFNDEDIKDINDKAIWYEFHWGSGMGGPGCVKIYTRDLKLYYIEGLPKYDHIKVNPGETWVHQLAKVFPILDEENLRSLHDSSEKIIGDWIKSSHGSWREYIHKDIKIQPRCRICKRRNSCSGCKWCGKCR